MSCTHLDTIRPVTPSAARLRGMPEDGRHAGCTCACASRAATSAAATPRRTSTRRSTSTHGTRSSVVRAGRGLVLVLRRRGDARAGLGKRVEQEVAGRACTVFRRFRSSSRRRPRFHDPSSIHIERRPRRARVLMRPLFSIRQLLQSPCSEAVEVGGRPSRSRARSRRRALAHAARSRDPEGGPAREPSHWPGTRGASVAIRTMIEPAPSRVAGRGTSGPMRSPTRHRPRAAGRRPGSPARAHPRSNRPRRARGGPDTTLEAVADHAGAAADSALLERAVVGARAPRRRARSSRGSR